MNKLPKVKEMSRTLLEQRYYDAISLLDGCYEIVELFKPESPSQVAWKENWLENARKHGASGF